MHLVRASRLGRAVLSWVSAAVALIAMVALLSVRPDLLRLASPRYHAPIKIGVLLAAGGFGALAARAFLAGIFADRRRGAVATPIQTITTWVVYALLGLLLTSALGVNLSGFILGSAVLGVVLGTAAQSSLGNLFAGIVLMAARPYRVGDWTYLRSGSFGGAEYEGIVVEVGALYTTLLYENQPLRIPNSIAITAVVRTDSVPMHAMIETTVPGSVSVAALREAIRDGLRLGDADRVAIRPRSLGCTDSPSLSCEIEVRSAQPAEPSALVEVVRAAVSRAERNGGAPERGRDEGEARGQAGGARDGDGDAQGRAGRRGQPVGAGGRSG